ncbi:MAG: endonuclease Q family protein [Candidatus Caldatribacteriota bacterium]|nr:endonuclease Q family protein [Candidatus Caldatribacteriota bacterium]
MNKYFMDLHVHIGRSSNGAPVKITASRDLTFANIAKECKYRKGIDIVGIVDCASPGVIDDISQLIYSGEMKPLKDGGLIYQDKVIVILGSEIETKEKNGGLSHQIAYFPYFEDIKEFSKTLSHLVTNVNLSTQNCKISAQEAFKIINQIGGILIPAHVFTPHKSVYGKCVRRIKEMFTPSTLKKIPAIELGLSADTEIADHLKELSEYTFLTNSDAHSLPKIGREYNIIEIENPSFKEVLLALKRKEKRKITANYGLDPKLGRYHRTFCEICNYTTTSNPPIYRCEKCGNDKVIKGVFDRIVEIGDNQISISPSHRPSYFHQVPLEFVPEIGKKTLNKLYSYFGNEMNILHQASYEEISQVVGFKIAQDIILARKGLLELNSGGGGKYGKVNRKETTSKTENLQLNF